jgi:hypothetical protein
MLISSSEGALIGSKGKAEVGPSSGEEEARLDERPEDSVSAELCESVSRVDLSGNI